MLHVVTHIPVEIAVNGVHIHRPAIQAVIEDIFGQASVLGETVDRPQPGAEEVGEADKHERKNTALVNRERDDA